MSNQTIPITLQPIPVSVTVDTTDINQLLQIIAQFMTGAIRQDVSFFLETPTDPTQYVGDVIFNTSSRQFKSWDTGAGKYLAVTQWNEGDTKTTFIAGDELTLGWVVLDGRKISDIAGLSAMQQSVLYQLFGTDGNLPTYTPLQTLTGLPPRGSFSACKPAATQPPEGQIGALAFDSSYNPGQVQALAQNTETLRDSEAEVNADVSKMAGYMETVLSALSGTATGPRLYGKVYCGSV